MDSRSKTPVFGGFCLKRGSHRIVGILPSDLAGYLRLLKHARHAGFHPDEVAELLYGGVPEAFLWLGEARKQSEAQARFEN